MMHYMHMQLCGVLQSYGGPESGWVSLRDTGPIPTRAAVAGILACALGVRRGDAMYERLLALDYRTTRCASASRREDFQIVAPKEERKSTAESVFFAPTGKESPQLVTSKVYLENASFDVLVGSVSIEELRSLHRALRHPRWVYYLGRACCTPSREIVPADFVTKSLQEWQEGMEETVCI